jgi:hypothetical protein
MIWRLPEQMTDDKRQGIGQMPHAAHFSYLLSVICYLSFVIARSAMTGGRILLAYRRLLTEL